MVFVSPMTQSLRKPSKGIGAGAAGEGDSCPAG